MTESQKQPVEPNTTDNATVSEPISEQLLEKVTGGKDSITRGLLNELEAEDTHKSNIGKSDNLTYEDKEAELNTPDITL